MNMKKIFLASACSSAIILSGCGGGGGDATQVVADLTVTISGQITDSADSPLPGVAIEGVYNNPGDPLNPSTNSNNNGNFSIDVLKSDAVYLRATKATYATLNSAKWTYNADEMGFDFGMPDTTEAQAIIDAAYGAGTALADKAWLVVDVVNAANGNEINNQSIAVSPAPEDEVYTACTGFDSGASATIAPPCNPSRPGPMYIASFAASATVNVTVATETQTAVLTKGEITYLDFEQ